MGIEIIGKLTQKNNGDFKLVDLENVDYDGTGKSAKQELEKKIEDAKNSSTPYDDTAIKTDINNIKTDLGTEELTTTAKDVKGAVNEVAAQYKDIANNKADKTTTQNIQQQVNNLVLQAGNPDSCSAEITQARSDEKVINDRLLKIENGIRLKDKCIDFNHLSFLDVKYNLFKMGLEVEQVGYMFEGDQGNTSPNDSFSVSGYIAVKGGLSYFQSNKYTGCFYDSNKNFIGFKSFNANRLIKMPDNCAFYRFTYDKGASQQYLSNVDYMTTPQSETITLTNNAFIKAITQLSTQQYIGKKIAVIGDSWSDTRNNYATKRWFDWVAEKTGATVKSIAVSGSGFKKKEDTEESFYHQALKLDSDCDLVCIFGSGNDCGTTNPYDFGTYKDTSTSTIGGCMNKTIDNIVILPVRLGSL